MLYDALDILSATILATPLALLLALYIFPAQGGETVAKKTIRCNRCNRRLRRADGTQWNQQFKRGLVVAHICPRCQTPRESMEGQRNAALPVTYLNGKHYEILSAYKQP